MKLIRIFTVVLLGLFMISETVAQSLLPEVRVSPQASVTQHVGLATIKINYSRPGVKGREIWGKLVPYDTEEKTYLDERPMPWRAGADENTTITFSHDAKVNGNPIHAGTYGLHMIVEKEEWTIIFSKENKAWGSYFYNQANDQLRVKTKPIEAPFQEWMIFGFDNLTAGSCDAFLQWEKIKVPFNIEFDKHKIVVDTYREELTGNPGFFSNEWRDAARYCLDNNVYLEVGLDWIERAYKTYRPDKFSIDVVKAGLLKATGKNAEAEKLLDEGMKTASEENLTDYGRQLLNAGNMDDVIKTMEFTVGKYPDSWLANYYCGIAYASKGDKEKAKAKYEKALSKAPDNVKPRIEGRLKAL
ncbi:MAG: hypothetical protein A2V66_05450 [Ignavibacteria bacterium RBG_13_36_8]|nr:MAG: hypothetical protein A2V66_05450 [Ignavibacteria bacterium RBG_13_36_8]